MSKQTKEVGKELQALGEYPFFNWLFKCLSIDVMDTGLKEAE